jgi:RNA polymerase sigma-70 factor (ECF subfamily)
MSPTSTEAALLSAAKGGDRAALGRLLLLHSDQLSRQLAAKMPPSLQRLTSADDILQQTFALAFRDIETFEPRGSGSFYAWLRTIADHQLQNAIKSASRQKRGGTMQQVEVIRSDSGSLRNLLELVDAGDGTPSLALRKEEAITALNVALAELPDDYREVIRLRFFLGFSLEETAQAMSRTPSAIRALTDRAKRQLRAAMGRLSQYLSAD